MKQYRYARAGRQYRSIPALFRDDLLIFRGEWNLFADYFVPLHPKNNKTKEIMPEISKFYGIIIYMYIDDHNPPHFHVWYDDYQAEVTIKDGIVRGEMPRRALRLVYEWLDLHRDELMETWERLSNSEAAKKIDPLK